MIGRFHSCHSHRGVKDEEREREKGKKVRIQSRDIRNRTSTLEKGEKKKNEWQSISPTSGMI
jgi:hypothetical protein